MIRSNCQRSLRLAITCATVLLPLSAARATDVWVVDQGGGGDFTTIQAAVHVAADGDTVLVRAGSYAGFAVNAKGVAGVADAGAFVALQGSIQVENLPTGSVVHLAGLSVLASGHADVTLNSGLYLQNNQGPVRGFDRWVSYEGPGSHFDQAFNVDGELVESEGFQAGGSRRRCILTRVPVQRLAW